MSAGLRVRLKLKMIVGPLRPSANADVYLTLASEPDGSARIDISRIVIPNNAIYSFVGGLLKEKLTEQINYLVRSALRDIPKYMPEVEEFSILEIAND
jgi:hypothetical protein